MTDTYKVFDSEDIVERLEEIACRAYSQGGADNLAIAIQALEAMNRIRSQTNTPKKSKGPAQA